MVKSFTESHTLTWTQSTTTWTQGSSTARRSGVDLGGLFVKCACSAYNSATVIVTLQGTNEGSDSSPPDDNSGWVDLEAVQFTANGQQMMGGMDRLVRLGGLRFYRLRGSLDGSPTQNVTVSALLNCDYED